LWRLARLDVRVPQDRALTLARLGRGPDGLTRRELQVLRLLATGRSNPEIAAELVLSVKTVMHHSVSIYGKLRVRGRSEATAYAIGHGLSGPTQANQEYPPGLP
jgi:DNA-binding NarL/FixJ family response regulator